MVSITVPMEEEFKARIEQFPWVNWSKVGREEMVKREIFRKYLQTGEISDEEWALCDKIDWHPVDELPMKEESIKRLEAAKRERSIKLKSVSEIFEKAR